MFEDSWTIIAEMCLAQMLKKDTSN